MDALFSKYRVWEEYYSSSRLIPREGEIHQGWTQESRVSDQVRVLCGDLGEPGSVEIVAGAVEGHPGKGEAVQTKEERDPTFLELFPLLLPRVQRVREIVPRAPEHLSEEGPVEEVGVRLVVSAHLSIDKKIKIQEDSRKVFKSRGRTSRTLRVYHPS